jgi:peptidoglycan/LPS O-acetylase OafA/YrhL
MYKYLFNFDLLRTFALFSVLVFHFFPSYAPWGFAGVDVFIFLSGYLLESKLASGQNILLFIERRFVRIFPPLLVVIFLSLMIGWFSLLFSEYTDLIKSSATALLGVSNLYQASLSGYFDGYIAFRPFLHLWSLSVEMQFYMVIGLSYFFISKTRARVMLLSILVLISFIYSISHSTGSIAYFSTVSRLWEFMLGALLFHLSSYRFPRTGAVVSFCALLLMFRLIYPETDYPGFLALLPLVFGWGVLQIDFSWASRFIVYSFRFFASISYSLFLVHYPLLALLNQFQGQPSVLSRIFLLALSIFIAWLIEGVIIKKVKVFTSFRCVSSIYILVAVIMLSVYLGARYMDRPVDTKNSILLKDSFSFMLAPVEACDVEQSGLEGRCRFSGVDSGDILFVGDSISHSLSPALDELKRQGSIESYRQIGAGSCPPFGLSSKRECQRFWQESFSKIEVNSFNTLLVSGQWSLYLDPLSLVEREVAMHRFLSELERLSESFKGNIVFFTSPPLGARPKSCFDRVVSSIFADCSIPIETAVSRRSSEVPLLEALSNHSKIKVYDFFGSMCTDGKCAVNDNGKLIYLDDSHFSISGAESQASLILEFITDS